MMRKFIQTQCLPVTVAVLVYAIPLLTGCSQQKFPSPKGYDFNHPVKMQLGKVLNEISGLTYYPQKNALLAIADDKEKVIEINVHKQKLKDVATKISEPGQDFEDLVAVDSIVYVLASRGVIKSVSLLEKDSSGVQEYDLGLSGKNDFESLYNDPAAGGLIMLCKTCEMEKGNHERTAFRFDLAGKRFDETPYYTIDIKAVRDAVNDSKADFKPSAAAIHPIDKRLYILSSAGQLLVIADPKGKVQEAYKLDPILFPQPEGIAFTPNGDLFISNEGKNGKPTLLFFPYHKKSSKENE